MPSQDHDSVSVRDQSAKMCIRDDESDKPEKSLFEAIAQNNCEQLEIIISKHPDLNLNCIDNDELTPLQHACHTGNDELAKILLNNGAGVNFTKRKDGYTPLMFAAISSRANVVRLLLERGVDTTTENCVHRTAAQMAAFVGQTKIVAIINNWIPYETSVEPFTRRRELEDEPRIPAKNLGRALHEFIVNPAVHPIKLLLYIRENLTLLKYGSQFIYVLENLSSKSLKPPRNEETLCVKYYYLSYLLKYCLKACKAKDDQNDGSLDEQSYGKIVDLMIRKLVRNSDTREHVSCRPQLDMFIVECLMKFPYTYLSIFNTITFALSKREPGDLNAYAILTQILDGPRMFGHAAEACWVCGEFDKNKKCSNCKKVYYCGKACQKVDWFQHRRVCKSSEEEPLLPEKT